MSWSDSLWIYLWLLPPPCIQSQRFESNPSRTFSKAPNLTSCDSRTSLTRHHLHDIAQTKTHYMVDFSFFLLHSGGRHSAFPSMIILQSTVGWRWFDCAFSFFPLLIRELPQVDLASIIHGFQFFIWYTAFLPNFFLAFSDSFFTCHGG
jgi:hypothetical protein